MSTPFLARAARPGQLGLQQQLPLARYFIINTLFRSLSISRAIFTNLKNIRILLIILLIIGAYSAVVSFYSTGPPPSYGQYIRPRRLQAGQRRWPINQRQRTRTHHRISVAVILATTIGHPRWRALLWVITPRAGTATHTRRSIWHSCWWSSWASAAKGYRGPSWQQSIVLIIGDPGGPPSPAQIVTPAVVRRGLLRAPI
jgi:hypothetical protein